ncbi:hypothetical protein I4U23_019306 [Adineta vaga]|nr:hypothetical protein I4U23_019306 [Adineta vaga]
MLIKYLLWKHILYIFLIIHCIKATHVNRVNLARLHPCNSINRRLEHYIEWTEKLASTQYKVQKDACGQTGLGPACCTNEIFNSYTITLGKDLKNLFDAELNQIKELLFNTNKRLDIWSKEYLSESRRITISSLESIFGTKEYHSNIHHILTTLFNFLGHHRSSIDDVSKATNQLFDELILSSYRRFVTYDNDIILDDHLRNCLITKASDINALPAQRELLYSLTSATSLLHILRSLFIYFEADIHRLKASATLNSHQCLQRYVRESLCPICMSTSSSIPDDNDALCEDSCRFIMKTCFEQTNNPYIAFTLIAQGYSNVIKEIQESIVELKLVERLSKLHIYLYDMAINTANSEKIYRKLKDACPDPNRKAFSPILSLPPTISERHEIILKWNDTLHATLEHLQMSIGSLNESLPKRIINDICLNSNYAVKSSRCTSIDQHMPENFTQWPLPFFESNAEIRSNLNIDSTRDQLNDLEKKLLPIRQMIISLRPKEKPPLVFYVPYFNESDYFETNDHPNPSILYEETYENDIKEEPLSERLYNEFDQQNTTRSKIQISLEPNANHSRLITHNIISYLFVFVLLIIHRISLTKL